MILVGITTDYIINVIIGISCLKFCYLVIWLMLVKNLKYPPKIKLNL